MSIEITEFAVTEPAPADWSFMSDDETMRVVERAVRSIARKYEDTRTTEYDDAYQDALVLMSTHRLLQGDLEPGILYTRLTQQLTTKYRTEAGHRSQSRLTSWELNNEKLSALGY